MFALEFVGQQIDDVRPMLRIDAEGLRGLPVVVREQSVVDPDLLRERPVRKRRISRDSEQLNTKALQL